MLRLENIQKTFHQGSPMEKTIFQGLNLEVDKGSFLAIIGPNGCGKSTLLNLIAGSLAMDDGKILIEEEDISKFNQRKRSKYLGRVHQNPSQGVSPSLSILENMALADNKMNHFNLTSLVDKKRIDYYKELLSSLNLGLENMLDTKVSLLSGGQRQSLSLIMASMKHPKLLLLDEHTASLDPKTSKVVMEKTLDLIKKNRMTSIMVTHNMKDAIEYSDRVLMLKDGEIAMDEKSSNITEEDLNDLYRMNNVVD